MDKKTILEEGYLELYALGVLSANESAEVEKTIGSSEELRLELEQIELELERTAMMNAVAANPNVKAKVMNEISDSTATESENVDSIDLRSYRRKLTMASSAAAVFALLFGWQLLSKNDSMASRVAELESELTELREAGNQNSNQLAYFADKSTQPITLRPLTPNDEVFALIYWNPESENIYISPANLPDLPDDKTYQLWADIEGEMVSMGIFGSEEKLISVPLMPAAESLNITIEPAGGSEHATVENLVVNAVV